MPSTGYLQKVYLYRESSEILPLTSKLKAFYPLLPQHDSGGAGHYNKYCGAHQKAWLFAKKGFNPYRQSAASSVPLPYRIVSWFIFKPDSLWPLCYFKFYACTGRRVFPLYIIIQRPVFRITKPFFKTQGKFLLSQFYFFNNLQFVHHFSAIF